MNMNLFWTFVVLNIVNVIIQTVKSLATIKCGKSVAALVNAVAYGLYTVVVVYTVCELPLWLKVLVVALCNLVGVFVVKFMEEKSAKAKLWKVEITIPAENANLFHELMEKFDIPHNYIPNIGKWTIFNCFCSTKKQSALVKQYAEEFEGKTFASESKTL
jgi:uncharacterized protein YebE (UPF0316 family)